MKNFFSLLFLVYSLTGTAQINNFTYSDCDANTENIYGVLSDNKVLLIASKALDCSICMNSAPTLQNFASTQQGRIRVWGAMNYKYSSNVPNCSQVNNWKSTYSWNNIFMFIDSNDDWEGQGYPTYYVISPVDSTIVYEGVIWSTASSKAIQLADSLGLTTGISSKENNENITKAFITRNQIHINLASGFKTSEIEIFLTDILGNQIVRSKQKISDYNRQLIISSDKYLPTGIYMLYITSEGRKIFSRKLFSIN
jgi:hypothetical protein